MASTDSDPLRLAQLEVEAWAASEAVPLIHATVEESERTTLVAFHNRHDLIAALAVTRPTLLVIDIGVLTAAELDEAIAQAEMASASGRLGTLKKLRPRIGQAVYLAVWAFSPLAPVILVYTTAPEWYLPLAGT